MTAEFNRAACRPMQGEKGVRHAARLAFTGLATPFIACLAQPLAAAPELSDQAILDQAYPAVVQVITETRDGHGTGTGFVLNDRGYVATNHHVVEGGIRYTAKHGTRTASAERVWSSENLDLAVIRTGLEDLNTVVLALSPPRVLADVIAIGFPGVAETIATTDAAEPSFSKGNVGRRVVRGSWNQVDSLRIVQHTAQINPGNSGGPLIDSCGRVVGVNTAGPRVTIQQTPGGPQIQAPTGVFWASFIAELAGQLDALGIAYESSDETCEPAAPAVGVGVGAEAVDDLRRQIEEQQAAIEAAERRRDEAATATLAQAEAKLADLRRQLEDALSAQTADAESARQREADAQARRQEELTDLREEVRSRWVAGLLVTVGVILALAGIAFVAYASFRRTVGDLAVRIRDGASRVVRARKASEQAAVPVTAGTVGRRIRIGRGEGMDVRLRSAKVSRYHAKLEILASDYRLTDRQSTNGTRVLREDRWESVRHARVEADEPLELGDYRTTAADLARMAGPADGRPAPAADGRAAAEPADDLPRGPVKRDRRTGEVVGD